MHIINAMPSYIMLGNQRDFGHTIQFDLTAWADLNADDWKITYMRPDESATYPVPDGDVSVADNVLTWTISEAVTAINGTGSVVIEAYRGGEMLKHSARIMTIIGAGHEPAGEAPDPVADWIEEATSKLAEVDHFIGETIEATESANAAAGLTNDAIDRANAISETMEGIAPKWASVDIDASALPEGAAPTASITQDETGTSISLGIPKGDKGDTGDTGPQGPKGDTGPSAYDAAVAGGYTGTEADFNAVNAGIEAAKNGALEAAETANEAAENAETAAYRSMLWRKTASGNPVSMYPVPESPLYPKVSGTFTQAGTGDPSPSNIRPITPWLASGASTSVKRTGKNLLDSNYRVIDAEYSSASVTIKDWTSFPFASGVYTVSCFLDASRADIGDLRIQYAVFAEDGVTIESTSYGSMRAPNAGRASKSFSAVQGRRTRIYVSRASELSPTTIISAYDAQLEFGSVATPYEPYTEQEITLTAPQEIPAGWMDNEGSGQITHGYIASYVDETVPDGWVSSIGELSAGAQVVYPLATPIDITPTAAPLTALPQLDRVTPRQNVLTASTGNVELTYAKSPIREADELAAAIAALP